MNLFILIFLLSFNVFAFDSCGIYKLNGTFKKSANPISNSVYTVNEGTRSELKFRVKRPLDLVKLSLSDSKPTSIKVKILTKMDNTYGEIDEVQVTDPRFINPLNKGTLNMILLEPLKCLMEPWRRVCSIKK